MLIPPKSLRRDASMKEVRVEIICPEPPCVRCQAARKTVEKVAEEEV